MLEMHPFGKTTNFYEGVFKLLSATTSPVAGYQPGI